MSRPERTLDDFLKELVPEPTAEPEEAELVKLRDEMQKRGWTRKSIGFIPINLGFVKGILDRQQRAWIAPPAGPFKGYTAHFSPTPDSMESGKVSPLREAVDELLRMVDEVPPSVFKPSRPEPVIRPETTVRIVTWVKEGDILLIFPRESIVPAIVIDLGFRLMGGDRDYVIKPPDQERVLARLRELGFTFDDRRSKPKEVI